MQRRIVRPRSVLHAVLALTLLIAARPLHAALFFSEEFDYPANSPLAGAAGGTGFSGPWTGRSLVASPGLAYSGFYASGNAASVVGTGSSLRPLKTTYDTTGTVVWLAFLIRQDAATPRNTNAYGGVSLGASTGGHRLFIGGGFQDNQSTWGMNTAGTGTSSHSKVRIVPGQTTLLVAKITRRDDQDLIELFVNPPLTAEPRKPDATKKDLELSIDQIRIESRDTNWTIDEIRCGGTFFDVTGNTPPHGPLSDFHGDGAWALLALLCATLTLLVAAIYVPPKKQP